ncbi:hypothetical protein [Bacillus safensis]|uniref:hypothetical protein n=1 Tax=Bacillus safensis TaxID=561879 RepID=UPI00240CF548|nr:hypothetical protein [Bacillus safensis]WEZ17806.1 hypothetical protein P5638_09255 [Bacillus safensis]
MRTEINKQIVKKNMAAKLDELKISRQAIETYLEELEDQKKKDNEYINSLKDRLTELRRQKQLPLIKKLSKKQSLQLQS